MNTRVSFAQAGAMCGALAGIALVAYQWMGMPGTTSTGFHATTLGTPIVPGQGGTTDDSELPKAARRTETIRKLAEGCFLAGHVNRALETLQLIKNDAQRDVAASDLLFTIKDKDLLEPPDTRDVASEEMDLQASVRHVRDASKIAGIISNPDVRARWFTELAKARVLLKATIDGDRTTDDLLKEAHEAVVSIPEREMVLPASGWTDRMAAGWTWMWGLTMPLALTAFGWIVPTFITAACSEIGKSIGKDVLLSQVVTKAPGESGTSSVATIQPSAPALADQATRNVAAESGN